MRASLRKINPNENYKFLDNLSPDEYELLSDSEQIVVNDYKDYWKDMFDRIDRILLKFARFCKHTSIFCWRTLDNRIIFTCVQHGLQESMDLADSLLVSDILFKNIRIYLRGECKLEVRRSENIGWMIEY